MAKFLLHPSIELCVSVSVCAFTTSTTTWAQKPVICGVMGPLQMAENTWVTGVKNNPTYRGYPP